MAQEASSPTGAEQIDRSATGGAQTLEDILARQRGEVVAPKTGDAASAAQELSGQLGVLGGSSDPELWRAMRYGTTDVSVSAGGDVAKVLIQDGGMAWYEFRKGPLATYGGYLLLGTIAALILFYVLRGRIPLDYDRTGRTVTRFKFAERMAHWVMAGSFVLLGFTGLFVKYGRDFIAPYLGKDFNSTLLIGSKFIHNNVAWAFMISLVVVFFMWVWHNIPNRTDIKWFAQAGGIVGSNHPPAKKFNGGQKIIFWSCILLGGSISMSGLSLLFPFELPLFAKTFGVLNDLGIPGVLGMAELPTTLAPQEEMQLAQAWHAIVSFVLMAIIIAHIYIGSIGMEGAYDAMGSGEVDEAWARQHHSIWLEEIKGEDSTAPKNATPAE
ncbi:formate dehydrogenase subunit gamma [Nereida sp. MMG024]|nr:formate dehydrogenase subunit gamma [Nereida sp. MMG025]MCF6444227.1 formate dehydrogenase subunit gamma [Nereida sp. MMG025]